MNVPVDRTDLAAGKDKTLIGDIFDVFAFRAFDLGFLGPTLLVVLVVVTTSFSNLFLFILPKFFL